MVASSLRVGLAILVGLGSAGCGSPFGPCYSEAVRVGLNGTWDGGAVALAGQVGPGNISGFGEVRRVLIDGQGLGGQSVTWTADGLGNDGYLALTIPAAFSQGQVFPVRTTFVGGGWGIGAGSTVAVSARVGATKATAVDGTITVLAAAPLRLRVDLQLGIGGQTRRLEGLAVFRFDRERIPCT
ncbi:MAG: hypothetical protein FJ206_11240 [Gemmatimonadetes bacterium]|nr:hypothetical protein [Gemmatimonadota bacterium]